MTYSKNAERARRGVRRTLLVVSTALCSSLASPAWSQAAPPPPATTDKHGVDLTTGLYDIHFPTISIGQGDGIISATRTLVRNTVTGGQINLWLGSTTTVDVLGTQYKFTQSGSTFTSNQHNGVTLEASGANYIFTDQGGTKYTFVPYYGSYTIQTEIHPDGKTLTYNGSTTTSNYGYQRNYNGSTGNGGQTVRLVNLGTDYCDNNGACPNITKTWPSLTFTQSFVFSGVNGTLNYTGTDAIGRQTKAAEYQRNVQTQGPFVNATVWRPGVTNPDQVMYDTTTGRAQSVTGSGTGATYAWNQYSTELESMITGTDDWPDKIVRNDGQYAYDGVNHYEYDSFGRVTKIIVNGGSDTAGYTQFGYDDRGNVISAVTKPRAGSTLPDKIVTAQYPSTCTNRATCNQPQWTKDANGSETDYTYDATTGQVLTVTRPPDSAGVRPVTTYSYTWLQAYYKNTAGQIVASGQPISKLTGISTCVVGSSCAGTANEVKTILDYGPQLAGVANNLLVVAITKKSGNGSVSSTVHYSYDPFGNLTSVDGPLPGTDDTTYYRYDMVGRKIGEIDPDPDGAGPRLRRAMRTSYNDADQITSVEIGTVTGTTDAAWAAFVSKQQIASTYDANGFRTTDTIKAANAVQSVVQYSYNYFGHLECRAVRMNSALWNSLPASACSTQTSGAMGPDQINEYGYTIWGAVASVQSGVGTPDASTDWALSFDVSLQPNTVTDANGNKTTYVYDGFDRLSKIEYPSPTKGSGVSSATDYEQLTYDAPQSGSGNGLVTSRRLRDGQTITYVYDHLNRLISKNLPGSEPDVAFSYDLLGRPSVVSQPGNVMSFTYDALGETLTETGLQGTVASSWDSGRRVKLTWPDGFYVKYDYNMAGQMTAVRENDASSGVGVLASYSYDDLGYRTAATYGNGTAAAWTPDALSRLSQFVLNFSGTNGDLNKSFTYNPASQIASVTSSNDTYAWNAAANVNRSYTTNGLNQYTASGGVTLGYDARGNLSSSASSSYSYSSENLMTTGPNSTTLSYDPLLRLSQVTQGANATRFAYDGLAMIAAYDSSNVLKYRYVYGPGVDEPIVQYAGAGTSSRTWLMADERGSVIAMTDSAGSTIAVNTYDEYGIPGSSNGASRFQYTGQQWLPELGLYYYKARMYSPSLGRFMQTDPIGYQDGLNWYNYAGSNPVNSTDPTGLLHTCNDGRVFDDGGYENANASADPCQTTPPPDIIVIANIGGFFGFNHFDDTSRARYTDISQTPWFHTPQNDDQGRPDYCFGFTYQAGKFLSDIGSFGDKVSDVFIVAGIVSGGTGLAPALGFKLAAGLAQTGGAALERLAGDKTATRRAVNAGIGLALPGAAIPKGLRNDAADLVAGEAQSQLLGIAEQTSPCK